MLESIITTAIGSFIGFTICYFVWYRKMYTALKKYEETHNEVPQVIEEYCYNHWGTNLFMWMDNVVSSFSALVDEFHQYQKDAQKQPENQQ